MARQVVKAFNYSNFELVNKQLVKRFQEDLRGFVCQEGICRGPVDRMRDVGCLLPQVRVRRASPQGPA